MDYLLDTGVLLRLAEPTDPRHAPVRAAVELLQLRGDRLFMSLQNVAEFWNACTRPGGARGGFGLSAAEAERRLRVMEAVVNRLPDSPDTYPRWRQLVITHAVLGVQVHDAKLVALMLVHGVTQILTLNPKDFRRYPSIQVSTPDDIITAMPPPTPPPPTL